MYIHLCKIILKKSKHHYDTNKINSPLTDQVLKAHF